MIAAGLAPAEGEFDAARRRGKVESVSYADAADEIVEAVWPGAITWRDHPVECVQCGAATELTLRLEVRRWAGMVGDLARG